MLWYCSLRYELMAIQTFKRFFSNSYFPAVLLLTIQLTTVFNFGKTASVMTSAIVAIMFCQVPRMGSVHKHHLLGKDQLPLQQLVYLFAVTVGCKAGLGCLGYKVCSSENDFSKCQDAVNRVQCPEQHPGDPEPTP